MKLTQILNRPLTAVTIALSLIWTSTAIHAGDESHGGDTVVLRILLATEYAKDIIKRSENPLLIPENRARMSQALNYSPVFLAHGKKLTLVDAQGHLVEVAAKYDPKTLIITYSKEYLRQNKTDLLDCVMLVIHEAGHAAGLSVSASESTGEFKKDIGFKLVQEELARNDSLFRDVRYQQRLVAKVTLSYNGREDSLRTQQQIIVSGKTATIFIQAFPWREPEISVTGTGVQERISYTAETSAVIPQVVCTKTIQKDGKVLHTCAFSAAEVEALGISRFQLRLPASKACDPNHYFFRLAKPMPNGKCGHEFNLGPIRGVTSKDGKDLLVTLDLQESNP